jgi:hypothetical protein
MITKDQIADVKKQLRKGVPAGEIKTQLIRDGHSPEDINKCFVAHKYDMSTWYLIFGIVFFIIGFGIFYKNGGILFFVFSAAMFVQYYLSEQKKKVKENE